MTLRPCRPGDRDDFIALECDPEVMRFLNGGKPVDNPQGDPNSLFLMPRGTEDYVWTAQRNDNGAFVGWFCLWPDNKTKAELGYRLRRAEWGHGFASEAASALIHWGFTSCGYERIMSSAMTVNHASRRVLERIGMTYARQVQLDWPEQFPGTELGEVEYEIFRPGQISF